MLYTEQQLLLSSGLIASFYHISMWERCFCPTKNLIGFWSTELPYLFHCYCWRRWCWAAIGTRCFAGMMNFCLTNPPIWCRFSALTVAWDRHTICAWIHHQDSRLCSVAGASSSGSDRTNWPFTVLLRCYMACEELSAGTSLHRGQRDEESDRVCRALLSWQQSYSIKSKGINLPFKNMSNL